MDLEDPSSALESEISGPIPHPYLPTNEATACGSLMLPAMMSIMRRPIISLAWDHVKCTSLSITACDRQSSNMV